MNAEHFFATRLRFQTDVSDVRAAIEAGAPGFVLLDVRSASAWTQGHLPGAVHLPLAELAGHVERLVPRGSEVVTYCWGPGCNGATRAALALARLGYRVREMLGGFEYWAREGFPVVTSEGTVTRPPDPLTAPCGC